MISSANSRCTENFQSCAGRTGRAVLDRMIQLGNTPDGECLEAAGQAKYLARFVLAAASEISQLPMVSVPEPMGDMRNVVPFRTQSA